jgi:hypothetical protein
MFENVSVFENMHSKFLESANMSKKYVVKKRHGV